MHAAEWPTRRTLHCARSSPAHHPIRIHSFHTNCNGRGSISPAVGNIDRHNMNKHRPSSSSSSSSYSPPNSAPSCSLSSVSSKIEPIFSPFSTLHVSQPPSRMTMAAAAACSSRSLLPHDRCSFPLSSSTLLKKQRRQTSPPPPPPSTNKKKLQVHFDPAVRGKMFECSPQDLQQTWHPKAAFCHFEEQMRSDVKLVRLLLKKKESGQPLDTLEQMALEATPTRGVEQFLSKNIFIDRTTKQQAVVKTVLAAQQRRLSADHISILSSDLSHEARQRALTNGMVDATEAARCHLYH